MPTFRITYRPACGPRAMLLGDVDADELTDEVDGRWLLLYRGQLVLDQPRRIVVLRLDRREVSVVRTRCAADPRSR